MGAEGLRNLFWKGKEPSAECLGLPEAMDAVPSWEDRHGGRKPQEKANPGKAFPRLSQSYICRRSVTEEDDPFVLALEGSLGEIESNPSVAQSMV